MFLDAFNIGLAPSWQTYFPGADAVTCRLSTYVCFPMNAVNQLVTVHSSFTILGCFEYNGAGTTDDSICHGNLFRQMWNIKKPCRAVCANTVAPCTQQRPRSAIQIRVFLRGRSWWRRDSPVLSSGAEEERAAWRQTAFLSGTRRLCLCLCSTRSLNTIDYLQLALSGFDNISINTEMSTSLCRLQHSRAHRESVELFLWTSVCGCDKKIQRINWKL